MQSPFDVISLLLPWEVIPRVAYIEPSVDVSGPEKEKRCWECVLLWETKVGFRAGFKTYGSVD